MDLLSRRDFVKLSAAAAAVAAAPQAAFAQAWPTDTVRVIVPYPAGGGADITSRLIAQKLSEKYGKQFIVDNRGGGGATIGETAAFQAKPDGYTVLYDGTPFSVNPALHPGLIFNAKTDFVPVTLTALIPAVLVVNNSVDAKTVEDVIRLAKESKEGLNWGSSGTGSFYHMMMERLKKHAGGNYAHIPYSGGAPALKDLIGNQIQFMFADVGGATPHVKAGTIRAIAHTGAEPLPNLPDIPAMKDTIPGFVGYNWLGVLVRKGVPDSVVVELNKSINEVIKTAPVQERLKQLNIVWRETTPAEFKTFVDQEIDQWSEIVREAKIKVD